MPTNHQGTTARTLPAFTLYRVLRRFAGPVLAYRLAFGGRA